MEKPRLNSRDLYPAIFSRHADAYAERLQTIMARREAHSRERLLELLDAKPGMHVLDLACGPGTLTARIASEVAPRATVSNRSAFRTAAVTAGFESAEVELIEERAHWRSPEHFVSASASWWSCAARLDLVSPETRESFLQDALTTVRQQHAGEFETTGRAHVILAIAAA